MHTTEHTAQKKKVTHPIFIAIQMILILAMVMSALCADSLPWFDHRNDETACERAALLSCAMVRREPDLRCECVAKRRKCGFFGNQLMKIKSQSNKMKNK